MMQAGEQAARPSALRRSLEAVDRRRFRRVQWAGRVRGLTASGEEFEATTVDVCAGGLSLNHARPLSIGEALVLYIDDIGRVEGVVTKTPRERGSAIEFRINSRKRDKIADQLTWLINAKRLGLTDEREAERRVVGGGQVIASFGAGLSIACAVSDVSIFGVALKTTGPRPMIGDKVTVGERAGTCVRYIDGGFAVDFRTMASAD
jgi:hypothetical protein